MKSPYAWSMIERELGLFDKNRDPKPVAYTMQAMSKMLDTLPDPFPKRLTDGICLLTREQNQQNTAFGSLILAKQAGIAEDKMILDPGIGFAKDYTQNLTAIRDVGKVVELGYPVLLGTSRKSVIGLTLDLPSDKRLEGTLVTTVVAVQNGCSFVRVHDVKENYRAIQMTKAIYRG